MLEILYYIFIFPLEQVLDYTLFVLHKLSGSYGLSIIALSLLVNALMLKITLLFERKGRAVQVRKMACDSKIAEFKRVFKGAELQSYIRTLYKQRHFHPIHTLAGLGGLAVQIPFFIAILHLVEHSNFLHGVGFLWISDLSKPDSVAGIESLHLLPLIMTALTLINVFYSVQERRARIQGVFIALFFLVLLYNMPSALVLYWSCNMAFSLAKEVVKKWRGKREGAESRGLDSKRGQSLGKASESALGNDKAQNLHSRHDSLGGMRNLRYVDSRGQGGIAVSKGCNALAQKGFISRVVYGIFPPHSTLDSKSYATYRDISIFAILNICFMICVFTPYAVFVSDLEQFNYSYMYATLAALFGFFVLLFFFMVCIFTFLFKTVALKPLSFFMCGFLLIAFIYTFILTGKYPLMSFFIFESPLNVTHKQKIIDTCVIISCVFLSAILIHCKIATILCKILFFTMFVISCINIGKSIKYVESVKKMQNRYLADNKDKSLAGDDPIFNFSSKEKNILVVVLDRADGYILQQDLKENPNYLHAFDGFMNFTNALSVSTNTLTSLSSIIGGDYFTPININKREGLLKNKIAEGYANTLNSFANAGYDTAGKVQMPAFQEVLYPMLKQPDNIIFDTYKYEYMLKKDNGAVIPFYNLIDLGIFKSLPYRTRLKIYKDGQWFFTRYVRQAKSYELSLSSIGGIWALKTFVSNTAKKPTFKFFHFGITHTPYVLNSKCEVTGIVDIAHPKDKTFYVHNGHYNSQACAFRWLNETFERMKQLHVYDNTEIFVTSDHGANWHFLPLGGDFHIPFLYKPIYSHGELKKVSSFVSHEDIPSIFCHNLSNGCPHVKKNILLYPSTKRELVVVDPVDWNITKHTDTHFILTTFRKFNSEVGDIYNRAGWQNVTKEFKQEGL